MTAGSYGQRAIVATAFQGLLEAWSRAAAVKGLMGEDAVLDARYWDQG